MTNEEAIKILQTAEFPEDYTVAEIQQALDMAIKALSQTEGNLISRQSAIDVISSVDNGENHIDELTTNVIGYIEQLPSAEKTAEVRPMQVELEADGYADEELVYDYGKCPNCGWEFEEGDKDWEEPYCCHCGQKLKWFETEEEE